jgi:hypothetical protein
MVRYFGFRFVNLLALLLLAFAQLLFTQSNQILVLGEVELVGASKVGEHEITLLNSKEA